MDHLTAGQAEAVALFREVTAGARDEQASVQMLKSCGWNVEQALQLHWAAGDDVQHAEPPASTGSSSGGLGAPLLNNSSDEARSSRGSRSSTAPRTGGASPAAAAPSSFAGGFVSWIASGLWRIGAGVVNVFCAFIFGPGGVRLTGSTSGAAFARALTNSYGSELQLPRFFEGTFQQALQRAQRELKLMVVFLHSEYARDAQHFCTNILAHDAVRGMLDGDGFLLWGGDVARMEAHHVAQVTHARQYPCFCILLPASVDEIRVIGTVQGNVEVDRAVALLMECTEAMESHRAEIVARSAQHVEDRHLREAQDREYQMGLEMDKKRIEEQAAREHEEHAARCLAEEKQREEDQEFARLEAERAAVGSERRRHAALLEVPGPDASACIALRLPTGQRVQRKFRPDTSLRDVYTWASCVGFMPENEGKGLEIPKHFVLKTSFPTRDLTELDRTVAELQLAGTNLLMAELEDAM